MTPNPRRISRPRAGLVAIDLQERLLPAIFERERVLRNSVTLIQGMGILGRPVFATEQYPKGLGGTSPEITAALAGQTPITKLCFSACGDTLLRSALEAAEVKDVLLCGIETHVCVTQTCLDLLEAGFAVFVAADATSSRTPENHHLGLGRMRDAGAVIVSTEMALFEMLERAGTPELKQILALVK